MRYSLGRSCSGSWLRGWMFAFLGGLFCVAAAYAAEPKLEVIGIQKIWDLGGHNAFTDLTFFDGNFYCVFREASAHVSPDGTIRVLRSSDGEHWESCALIALQGFDLRDPKIVVHPDGKQLMINGGAAVREGKQQSTEEHSFVSFSTNGQEWSTPTWVAETGQWLWRVTWFGEKFYGIAYNADPTSRTNKSYGTLLLGSDDGKLYSPIVPALFQESGPTEATLRFTESGTCYCLQRRDGKPSNTALLGTSQPPYQEWAWKDLGRYFGGPDFLYLPMGYWIAVGRLSTGSGSKTVVCQLDVEKGILKPLLTLPSGGDTSYPGLLWHDDILWISYYSSHEGKTSIFLAILSVQ